MQGLVEKEESFFAAPYLSCYNKDKAGHKVHSLLVESFDNVDDNCASGSASSVGKDGDQYVFFHGERAWIE